MKITTTESENIEVYLGKILDDIKDIEEEVLKVMRATLKDATVDELRRLKRSGKVPEVRGKHMYEDVVSSIVKDRYGGKVLRVRGGSKTGTIWHLLNDGTYGKTGNLRTHATHFLDRVIVKADKEFQEITDKHLRKRSE